MDDLRNVMDDLYRLSDEQLSARRAAVMCMYFAYRVMMKIAYMRFLEVDTEFERRKLQDKHPVTDDDFI